MTNNKSFTLNRAAENAYSISSVISKDGTVIGYRQLGQGPGVVLVQGAMGSAHNFSELAEELSEIFTVYIPDRRGRGISACPYHDNHSIQRDIEDLEAILIKTGTHLVFGLSSGALIALKASTVLSSIHKVVAYEPPLFLEGLPVSLFERFKKEISKGNIAAALIVAGKAVKIKPMPWFMPEWLLAFIMNRVMANEDSQPEDGYLHLKELTIALQYDFSIITEMYGKMEQWRAIKSKILLLGGGKSPLYLKKDLDAIGEILLHAKKIVFPDLDHSASWNYDQKQNPTGKPELVANELKIFLFEE